MHDFDVDEVHHQIVNLVSPGSRIQADGLANMTIYRIFFLTRENLLYYSHIYLIKAKYLIMISIKSFTYIVKFMAPGTEVQALFRGQYDHIVKSNKFENFNSSAR